jgi:hypothetical protein
MSTRGTQFTRVLAYFRDADVLEADACLGAAMRIIADRKRVQSPPPRKPRAARPRAQQASGAGQESLANA